MARKKVAFTPSAIDNLCTGKLEDALTPGLAIEVLKSGKKRWKYRQHPPQTDAHDSRLRRGESSVHQRYVA